MAKNCFVTLKQLNLGLTNYGLSSKTTQSLCFSKPYSVVTKIFKLLSLNCEIIEPKTSSLGINLSPIPNNVPKLYSEICSEMNNIPVTNLILL